ncbi:hypothetical protein BUALT_Bualt07G0114800 [Buddleja alternifolia]|uniref:NAC domain-containing protein n=1 Tax=Buddleja alternifolia TaxID=168488 RepID=A0AAV6XA42_9LAMI|nr:hypothetical protein BUALT_Bualt07G0114800 [Buddleja alternifolia]
MENLGKMKRGDGDEMSSIAETDPAIGFKFVPTEEQLIKFFLFRKAIRLPLPGFNPILEKDLYGDKHPSDVFSDILDCPYWNTTKDFKKEIITRKVPKKRSEIEEDGCSSTLCCKRRKTTLTSDDHDHRVIPAEPVPAVDEGNNKSANDVVLDAQC